MAEKGMVVVVMGVSGSGKTTVGEALAGRLGCVFYDGDDFHPAANIEKMAAGIPLDDGDRAPWLDALRDVLHGHLVKGEGAVLACSALKRAYRDRLRAGNEGVRFVYLRGDFELIWGRMARRAGHYMKAGMLQSQFEALEEPGEDEALAVPIEWDVDRIVEAVLQDTEGFA